MDLQAVIAIVLLGGGVAMSVVILPGFWKGERAKKMYQNALAGGLSPKWTSRLVQSWHLAVVWAASMVATAIASAFGSLESGPLTALEWVLVSLLGGSTILCLVAVLTGRPKWLMPPWARGQPAEDFLSGCDQPHAQ